MTASQVVQKKHTGAKVVIGNTFLRGGVELFIFIWLKTGFCAKRVKISSKIDQKKLWEVYLGPRLHPEEVEV